MVVLIRIGRVGVFDVEGVVLGRLDFHVGGSAQVVTGGGFAKRRAFGADSAGAEETFASCRATG
jgi:hypothetical protein